MEVICSSLAEFIARRSSVFGRNSSAMAMIDSTSLMKKGGRLYGAHLSEIQVAARHE